MFWSLPLLFVNICVTLSYLLSTRYIEKEASFQNLKSVRKHIGLTFIFPTITETK
jgi:hypothetical protein